MSRRLLLLLLALGSAPAQAQQLSLNPLPWTTTDLGGGNYSVLDTPGLRVTVHSDRPLPIASSSDVRSSRTLDLGSLPSHTRRDGPLYRVAIEPGLDALIYSEKPLPIETERHPTTELRGRRLPRLPGLPDDLTGSVTITERQGRLSVSYSLINLGTRPFTLDSDALTLLQDGVPLRATLDRRSGNRTPGLLEGGKGEIGLITAARRSSGPVELRWHVRSGDTTYTLSVMY